MTESEFKALQLQQQQSGKTLKCFIKELGVSYSTWNYWRKKCVQSEESHELAPISIKNPIKSSYTALEGTILSGTTLLFPNGLRAHFGTGSEHVLMELLNKSLSAYVLP